MELIVLGASASYPYPGEACAGYLIRDKNEAILVDIGSGVLSNLFKWMDPADLSALIISHLHSDHFIDIYPLRLYLLFERAQTKLKLFGPPKTQEILPKILTKEGQKKFEDIFDIKKINKKKIKIGSFEVTFKKAKHLEPTYYVAIEKKGKRLVYSADTAYTESLISFAKGCDLLICEATLSIAIKGVDHLTPQLAGEIAKKAAVKKLLITHVWPTFNRKQAKKIASEHFKGNIEIAQANQVYKV